MKEEPLVQPDRAKPRAPKLASGMFGAANDPAPPASAKKEPRDRTALDLQHLFGRDGE